LSGKNIVNDKKLPEEHKTFQEKIDNYHNQRKSIDIICMNCLELLPDDIIEKVTSLLKFSIFLSKFSLVLSIISIFSALYAVLFYVYIHYRLQYSAFVFKCDIKLDFYICSKR
jgi:hypothetical protein